MINMLRFATALAGIFTALGTHADGLSVKPGLWKTTTSVSSPMGSGMTTRTSQECIKQTSFDPAKMMQDAEECQITRNQVSGSQVDFAMKCEMEGMQAMVTGEFETSGDSGSGHMTMNMDGGGMKMEMKMSWTSERIGDC